MYSALFLTPGIIPCLYVGLAEPLIGNDYNDCAFPSLAHGRLALCLNEKCLVFYQASSSKALPGEVKRHGAHRFRFITPHYAGSSNKSQGIHSGMFMLSSLSVVSESDIVSG